MLENNFKKNTEIASASASSRLLAMTKTNWLSKLFVGWLSNLLIITIVLVVLVEILSYLGWRFSIVGTIATIVLVLVWLVVATRNLTLGVVWLILELMLGGFGYELSFTAGGTVFSIRMLLFAMAFSLLIYKIVTERKLCFFKFKLKWWYVVWWLFFIGALIVGTTKGNEWPLLVLDSERYLYWLLLPLFFEIDPVLFKKYALKILSVGMVWLWLKTSIGLYIFSHESLDHITWFYKWWRDTRFAEITWVGGNVWRIFSQSQIFMAILGIGLIVYHWQGRALTWSRDNLKTIGLVFICLSTIILSLSRSFWLGMVVSFLVMGISTYVSVGFKKSIKQFVVVAVLILSAVGFMTGLANSNWPLKAQLGSSNKIITARLMESDAATNSRWQLLGPLMSAVQKNLWWGSGFGSTVTYQSADPRAVQSSVGGIGLVTRYTFEWGYLELWLKFGLLGMLGYLFFLMNGLIPDLKKIGWRNPYNFSILVAVLSLLVINFTTPYLNHNLGIGILMILITLKQLEIKYE